MNALFLICTIMMGLVTPKNTYLYEAKVITHITYWGVLEYAWLDDKHIVIWHGYFRNVQEPMPILLNVQTQERQVYSPLARTFGNFRYFSYDRHYVIWRDGVSDLRIVDLYTPSKNFPKIPIQQTPSTAHWKRDSPTWVTIRKRAQELEVEQVDINKGSLKINNFNLPPIPNYKAGESRDVVFLGFLKNGNVLLYVTPTHQATTVDRLYEVSLDKPQAGYKTHLISLPSKCLVKEVVLSEQGTHLAWNVVFPQEPNSEYGERSQLFISKVGSSEFYSLGETTITKPPSKLQWSPRGDRLSFLVEQILYSLQVQRLR